MLIFYLDATLEEKALEWLYLDQLLSITLYNKF